MGVLAFTATLLGGAVVLVASIILFLSLILKDK